MVDFFRDYSSSDLFSSTIIYACAKGLDSNDLLLLRLFFKSLNEGILGIMLSLVLGLFRTKTRFTFLRKRLANYLGGFTEKSVFFLTK